MLVHYNQISDILYFEILDISLPELQGLKTLKVAFHLSSKDEVINHTIRLPKQSTVGDVLNDLKTKVELSHPKAELRLLEIFYHKINKIFPVDEKIENINDQYWTLRVEEIPEEEEKLGPHDRLIHVYHFKVDAAQNQGEPRSSISIQNFGEPFLLVLCEGETLAEVKVLVQQRLQVPDDEFSKWKFAVLSLGRPEYLLDSDIVYVMFMGRGDQYLGLEHSDTVPKRLTEGNQLYQSVPKKSYAANQVEKIIMLSRQQSMSLLNPLTSSMLQTGTQMTQLLLRLAKSDSYHTGFLPRHTCYSKRSTAFTTTLSSNSP
ncbi:hypothetical protein RHSIM_Rhsim05G0179200 [Rhododendron simsii]|uniref:ubiquitinyl hydrolase 1 n=1 Tax=Rhododendron simsii TaxID=118357 RepID=A0A834GZ96_RHOSS|nr:hypothetical protein RHSIM_Rhsim05G0179200 [Rhododendron simsii]